MTKDNFLKEHRIHFSQVDMYDLVTSFITEMNDGLKGKNSSLMMYPSRIGIKNDAKIEETTVLAIDAGGTNFRAALVRIDDTGKPEILQNPGIVKFTMPGIEYEISKDKFFKQVIEKLKVFKDKYDKIGFCFSYATEMQLKKELNGCQIIDGKLVKWSKGIKAPELVGLMLGENLLSYLKVNKGLVVLNDTVAALMAGKGEMKGYGSYIGFILGTGTNTSYIELNSNIPKEPFLNPKEYQIINIESGNFNKIILSDIDKELDRQLSVETNDYGSQVFEKTISGRYLGQMLEFVIKRAAEQGLFSKETCEKIIAKDNPFDLCTTEVVSYFISNKIPLADLFTTKKDKDIAAGIINDMLERAAVFVAGNIAAVILKTGKGKTPVDKVLIVADGSTFFKFSDYNKKVEKHLKKCFALLKETRYYDIIDAQIDDINLKGAAIAAAENV